MLCEGDIGAHLSKKLMPLRRGNRNDQAALYPVRVSKRNVLVEARLDEVLDDVTLLGTADREPSAVREAVAREGQAADSVLRAPFSSRSPPPSERFFVRLAVQQAL